MAKKKAKAELRSSDRARALLIDYAPDERWQRGAEAREEPLPGDRRPVQRADSGLAQLRRAGKIGAHEVVAATRWRSDYELGACGARDTEKSGMGGGVDGFNISATDALTRYNKAKAAVGLFGDMLLRAFVSDSLSLRQISEDLERQRQAAEKAGKDTTAMWSRQDLNGAVVAVLTRLGEHYAEIDASRDLPPWERSRIQDERRRAAQTRGFAPGGLWLAEVEQLDGAVPPCNPKDCGRAGGGWLLPGGRHE